MTDDFLKQFKSRDALNDFLGQLQKRGIEKMLEGELDGHLGYYKHEQSANSNSRNGYGKKKIRTSYGESEISVPRDRDASFNPMIVPKRENMVDGIEEVIVSLYAKGMSVSDIVVSQLSWARSRVSPRVLTLWPRLPRVEESLVLDQTP